MKDKSQKELKAEYSGRVYNIGWVDMKAGKVQLTVPIDKCKAASYVKVAKIRDVTFLLN